MAVHVPSSLEAQTEARFVSACKSMEGIALRWTIHPSALLQSTLAARLANSQDEAS